MISGVLGWISGSKENAVKQLLTGCAVDAGFGQLSMEES